MYPILDNDLFKMNKDESDDIFLVFVMQSAAQLLFA